MNWVIAMNSKVIEVGSEVKIKQSFMDRVDKLQGEHRLVDFLKSQDESLALYKADFGIVMLELRKQNIGEDLSAFM